MRILFETHSLYASDSYRLGGGAVPVAILNGRTSFPPVKFKDSSPPVRKHPIDADSPNSTRYAWPALSPEEETLCPSTKLLVGFDSTSPSKANFTGRVISAFPEANSDVSIVQLP